MSADYKDYSNDSDDERFYVTSFDLSRLKSMDVGDVVVGESQRWRVIKYKNEYVLIVDKNDIFKEFKLLTDLFEYLESL